MDPTNPPPQSHRPPPPKRPRKKPPPQHPKRELIPLEDGWTRVAHQGWRTVRKADIPSNDLSPSIDMTIIEMRKEYERHKKAWEESSAYEELRRLLLDRRAMENGKGKEIANIICLGQGSLQTISLEWRRASHTQLAALQTIREVLSIQGQAVMQDPHFTTLDASFLQELGYKVMCDPLAFRHIGEESLVFAVHCSMRLLWKARGEVGTVGPAVLIGNDVKKWVDNTLLGNIKRPEGTKLEAAEETGGEFVQERREDLFSLIDNCDEISFPQLRYDFSDTVIYWRHSPITNDISDAAVSR